MNNLYNNFLGVQAVKQGKVLVFQDFDQFLLSYDFIPGPNNTMAGPKVIGVWKTKDHKQDLDTLAENINVLDLVPVFNVRKDLGSYPLSAEDQLALYSGYDNYTWNAILDHAVDWDIPNDYTDSSLEWLAKNIADGPVLDISSGIKHIYPHSIPWQNIEVDVAFDDYGQDTWGALIALNTFTHVPKKYLEKEILRVERSLRPGASAVLSFSEGKYEGYWTSENNEMYWMTQHDGPELTQMVSRLFSLHSHGRVDNDGGNISLIYRVMVPDENIAVFQDGNTFKCFPFSHDEAVAEINGIDLVFRYRPANSKEYTTKQVESLMPGPGDAKTQALDLLAKNVRGLFTKDVGLYLAD